MPNASNVLAKIRQRPSHILAFLLTLLALYFAYGILFPPPPEQRGPWTLSHEANFILPPTIISNDANLTCRALVDIYTHFHLAPVYAVLSIEDNLIYNESKTSEIIPPFFKKSFRIEEDYMFLSQYNIGLCPSMHAAGNELSAVFCYLNDPAAFIREALHREATRKDGIMRPDICTNNNISFQDRTQLDMHSPNYTMLLAVRDPIDRFISSFTDYCTIHDCYGCPLGDVRCIVARLYARLWAMTNCNLTVFRDYNSPIDDMFVPQTWFCDQQQYYGRHSIFAYEASTDGIRSLVANVYQRLDKHGVPKERLEQISQWLIGEIKLPEPDVPVERKAIEQLIRNDPAVMNMLMKIYHFDYVVYNFKRPVIPTTTPN